jgi:hypothetical protein
MSSTTFIDGQSVIYASWLNDVNTAIYSGTFPNGSLSLVNLNVSGTVSGAGYTSLVNGVLLTPGPIGSSTPSSGAFTTLSATTPISVASGGSGAGSFTANSLLVGNGTSTFQTLAAGASGNVLTSNGSVWQSVAFKGLGFGATSWHDVSGSRSFSTNYTNSNAYPIQVCVSCTFGSSSTITAIVAGTTIMYNGYHANTEQDCMSFIVPAGAVYQVAGSGSLSSVIWAELY